MSLPAPAASPATLVVQPADSPAGETQLGRALALIHRVLPRLDDPGRAESVQSALREASAQIEAARAAHENWSATARTEGIEAETVALIAAAVAVVLGRAHRIVDLRKTPASVAWVNAWAMEGRFLHYASHKVR
ncbi:MAG: hypothetical protein AB7O66_05365 [Limisphaerales bacterium]